MGFVIIMITTCQMKTFGQTEIVSNALMPEPITKTIVRHYQNVKVVSYVQTTNNSYFTLSDTQNYHKSATIDPFFVVNDMEVYDGYAYFCGINTMANTGFIGYFKIADFFNGTDRYYILDYIPYDTLDHRIKDLNRLTVFKNNSGLHVTAIGHVDDPYNSSCIVDYLPRVTTGNNYYVGIASATGLISDFLDITCTDNYVVVSDLLKSIKTPTLRAFDIHNIFAPGGVQDYQYMFGEYLDNMAFNHNDLLIEHIESDIVATATYWKDLSSSNMFDGTNIRFFDINQMLTTPYMGMLYSFGIHQPYNMGFWKLYELRNDPNNQCLYLLQRTDENSALRRNAFIVNCFYHYVYRPRGLVSGSYIPHYIMQGLDVFNSNIISTGYDFSDNDELKYHLSLSFPYWVCCSPISYLYSSYSVSRNKIDYSPLNVYSSELYPAMLGAGVDENEIYIECSNYES